MKSFHLPVITLLALGLAAQAVAAPPKSPRPSRPSSLVEATADGVVLPGAATGILVVSCKGCVPRSFRATNATRYSLEGQPVTLNELRKSLAAQPQTNLNIAIEPKSGELLAVDAVSQLATSRSPLVTRPIQKQPPRKPADPRISR
jgi:hypothetical protein